MKKLTMLMALVMTFALVGCASPKQSWATIKKFEECNSFLYVSQEGDFRIYKEDGTVLFADDDMRSDSQYEMYDRGAAYINDQNQLILVSAITDENKVCDTNVAYLVGEGYSKFGATSGYLLLAYGVNEDGKIVAVNVNMIP